MPSAGSGIKKNYTTFKKKITLNVFNHTHRAVQFSLVVHGEVQTTVYPSDANQPHCQTNELQNTCKHIYTIESLNKYFKLEEYCTTIQNNFIEQIIGT